MSSDCRRRIIYRGRVQGVGFRATVRGIASNYPVTGFVRNLPDGTVELIVAGEEASIEEFLTAVRERMATNISREEAEATPGDLLNESFQGFTIRR